MPRGVRSAVWTIGREGVRVGVGEDGHDRGHTVIFSVVCALGRGNSKRFQDVHRELKYNGQDPKEKLEVCIIVVVLVLRSRLSVRSRTPRVCMVGVVIVISKTCLLKYGQLESLTPDKHGE